MLLSHSELSIAQTQQSTAYTPPHCKSSLQMAFFKDHRRDGEQGAVGPQGLVIRQASGWQSWRGLSCSVPLWNPPPLQCTTEGC